MEERIYKNESFLSDHSEPDEEEKNYLHNSAYVTYETKFSIHERAKDLFPDRFTKNKWAQSDTWHKQWKNWEPLSIR